jgi:fructose-1,6-bisphosphatase/inositol monophosphatase family enzyme
VAHKGQGAFKNGKPISVNEIDDIKDATISYIYEHNRTPKQTKNSIFGDLIDNDIKRFMMDRSPSNNFCLLAEGKIEGVMCNQESIYDFSAGKIIAEEA